MRATSRREKVSRLAGLLGITRLVERLARRPALLVVNYHRVGDPTAGGYDTALVEATGDEFDAQVAALKRRFGIVELAEAQEMIVRPNKISRPCVLITFDDGYRDNHDVALPILRAHGVRAAFFLTTKLVGSRQVAWWDQVAFMLRRTGRTTIQLEYPQLASWDLSQVPLENAIQEVLRLCKKQEAVDLERFVAGVELACDVARPSEEPRMFMSWDEARALVAAGMGIGSHTHGHEFLARLSPEAQRDECERSRDIIRENLGVTVDALAYPFGSRASFSDVTFRCLEETGYRTAFSYYGGANLPPVVDRFNVARLTLDRSPLSHYRLRVGLAMASGRQIW
ncbi:MAG TPA: polysaccharide deacetylase family protein [Polyangia bacterium]|nr:polysaccharide deacetylase family protein [Polyangia bacterium]